MYSLTRIVDISGRIIILINIIRIMKDAVGPCKSLQKCMHSNWPGMETILMTKTKLLLLLCDDMIHHNDKLLLLKRPVLKNKSPTESADTLVAFFVLDSEIPNTETYQGTVTHISKHSVISKHGYMTQYCTCNCCFCFSQPGCKKKKKNNAKVRLLNCNPARKCPAFKIRAE